VVAFHTEKKEGVMMNKTLAFLLFAGVVFSLPAAGDSIAEFKGGIGVIPTGSTNTTVRGVVGAGQIWVIADLRAEVEEDGSIKVRGEGLVLGAGNSAGRAPGQRVIATLICEAVAPFTERSTNPLGVPLAPNGDFRIDDVLTPAPVSCASPMLLIRNAANLGWFAVGIVDFGSDDD
jgi:hypothetical protein